MSYLIINNAGIWKATELSAAAGVFLRTSPRMETGNKYKPGRSYDLLLLPLNDYSLGRYVLIAKNSTRVNGSSVAGSIRVLRDRDEIVANRIRMYYSHQSFAKREQYSGECRECSICGCTITPGETVVQCPMCLVCYHESEDFPCWSSDSTCPTYGCDFETKLDQQVLWLPGAVL